MQVSGLSAGGELRDEKDPGLAFREGVNHLAGGCISIYNSPESRCGKAIMEVEREGEIQRKWGLEPRRGAASEPGF